MNERFSHFEKRKEKLFESPEKTLKSLHRTFLMFHYAGYKFGETANIPEGVNLDKNRLLSEKLKELKEEDETTIAYRFFKLHIRKDMDGRPELSIEFYCYRDNSALVKEIEKLGDQNHFSLSLIDENIYRLKLER